MISILWYSLCNFIAGFSPTFRILVLLPRAARHRHGCRVAGWRSARHGGLARHGARLHERTFARIMGHWLRHVVGLLLRSQRAAQSALWDLAVRWPHHRLA